MAKKKKLSYKTRFNKKQRIRMRAVGIPVMVGVVCLVVGITGTRFVQSRQVPANIVWAAEKSVQVPADLERYLASKNDCQNYRGADSPTGVGLWGVYQVSQAKFAKIAYGCSWSLSSYIMAVKTDNGWKLLQPSDYFAPFQGSSETGAIPLCSVIDTYKIDRSIEPFCVDSGGAAQENVN